jgi:hypothetical protein
MVMLLYMAVIFYGVSVMRAVLEEKNSRVMEVLLSSATSTELMAGKLIGVGAVGLTQIGIWITMASVYALPALAASASTGEIHIAPLTLVAFAVFFLLGYLLYSSVYAAVGAVITSEQEGQQLQFIILLPLILAVFMMGPVMRAPDSPIAVWTSMIPFFSPILMYVRIAIQPPPAWQIAAFPVAAGGDDCGDSRSLRAHLPHRNSDVWQAADAAGNREVAEVREPVAGRHILVPFSGARDLRDYASAPGLCPGLWSGGRPRPPGGLPGRGRPGLPLIVTLRLIVTGWRLPGYSGWRCTWHSGDPATYRHSRRRGTT